MKHIKVLFHGWEYPPGGGGVGAYMRNMALALKKEGHDAVILTGMADGFPAETEDCGVPVLRLYSRDEAGSSRVADLALAIAREHRVDLIEGADHIGDCAGILDARKRPPVLIKIHSSNALKVLRDASIIYGWQRLTLGMALLLKLHEVSNERSCIEKADLLCAPSRRVMDEMKKQGLRLPPKIAAIPNPVVTEPTVQSPESASPTLLLVGRIEAIKGIEFLPAIVGALVKRWPDIVLEIAGDDTYARGLGMMKDWLSNQFSGLANHVRFLGKLSRTDLTLAYSRAWVVIVPSRWDNFPTAILEAMSMSKAIVASPNGGMPEMLADTSCPVADPASPQFAQRIDDLLSDPCKRTEAGLSARRKVDTSYSATAVVGQYIKFVRESL